MLLGMCSFGELIKGRFSMRKQLLVTDFWPWNGSLQPLKESALLNALIAWRGIYVGSWPTSSRFGHRFSVGFALLICLLLGAVTVTGAPTQATSTSSEPKSAPAVPAPDAIKNEGKAWRLPVVPAADGSIPLVYTSNLNGELEPCGCTMETDYGGILRRGEVVRHLRKTFKSVGQEVLLLSAGGLLDDYGAPVAIKNTAILTGMQLLQFDGIGVQPRDLLYGVDFIAGKSLPWINSTALPAASLPDAYKDETGEVFQPFADHITVTRAYKDIAIFSILPYDQLFSMQDKKPSAQDFAPIVAKMAEKASNDNIVILMSAVPAAQLKKDLDFQWVDVLITPARDEHFVPPQWLGHTLWLQPGHRGMRMGVAQLKLTGVLRTPPQADPHAGLDLSVKSYSTQSQRQVGLVSHEVIALDNQVPDDSALAQWYTDYNTAVAEDYAQRSALQKKYAQGVEQQYLGEKVCAGCHAPVHSHWLKTDHANAFQTLEAKGKSFDPACLKCHTVAFHQPGGFIDIDVTEHLANVQCENCHVGTPNHVKNPTANKPQLAKETPQQICQQCHNKTHSPSFDFDSYWPRIGHDFNGPLKPAVPSKK